MREQVRKQATTLAVVLGLALNSMLPASTLPEKIQHGDDIPYDKTVDPVEIHDNKVASYRLTKEACAILPRSEIGACRAHAKAVFVALIEEGTLTRTRGFYAQRLRLLPDFLLIRSRSE